MQKKLTEAERIKDRIKLMMKYSMKETLSENMEKLNEQSVIGAPAYVTPFDAPEEKEERARREEEERKNKEAQKYPNYCRYPKMAVTPTENEFGLKGINAIPKGHCAYSQPTPWCKTSTPPKNKTSYIMIPKDSEVLFFENIDDLSNSVDLFWKAFSEKEQKLMKKNDVITQMVDIIPFGTVRQFSIGSSTYLPYVCYSKLVVNSYPENMSFGGYSNQNNERYESPYQKDERTDYQKFIDDWGTVLQWTAMIATATASLFCEGCTLPIAMEIALELGIGVAVGLREIEKGNDVAGYLSFITGALPMLKFSKAFRGMNPKAFEELSQSFATSGLKSSSPVTDYVTFYNNLSKDAKLAMNQILRSDELSLNAFKNVGAKELGDDMVDLTLSNVKSAIEADPSLLRKVPFTKRLWARELGTNATVTIAGTIVDLVWGNKLNKSQRESLTEEVKDKLDGIYSVVPERQRQEMTENLLGNVFQSTEFIKDPETQKMVDNGKKMVSNGMSNALDVYWKNKSKSLLESKGMEYKELPETQDIPLLDEINVDEAKLSELKGQGWTPIYLLDKDVVQGDTLRTINGDVYVKKQK